AANQPVGCGASRLGPRLAAAPLSGCAQALPRPASVNPSRRQQAVSLARAQDRRSLSQRRSRSESVVGLAYLSSPISFRRNAPEPAPLLATRQGTLRLGEARLGEVEGAVLVGRPGPGSRPRSRQCGTLVRRWKRLYQS